MRCVNLDWLEVYCLESASRFPCDADYFRRAGYFVKERDYGTRSYSQMFTIEDEHGNEWIEVRRAPQSGCASFTGLVPKSCHLRLTNRACYDNNAVNKLKEFMALHGYLFQRIYRIDVCLDFERFDTGDDPARFARRYLECKYRKVNQSHVCAHGQDNWTNFEWQSLSWGNPKSMVSTKMYNKSLELSAGGKDKPYIKYCWWLSGLVDNPVDCTKKNKNEEVYKPDIWRVEFSMKSQARNWIVIEDQGGKRVKRKAVPHSLSQFDSRDKLVQRFEDLAFHYFRFNHLEYKKDASGKPTDELKRKDLCAQKILFRFNQDREVLHLDQLPKDSKPNNADVMLKRRLLQYQQTHYDPKIREACEILIKALSRSDMMRLCERVDSTEVDILQRALSLKMGHDERTIQEIIAEIRALLSDNAIF